MRDRGPLLERSGQPLEEMRTLLLSDPRWYASTDWICAVCHEPAFYHPLTDILWGCRACGFVTENILVKFVSRRSFARAGVPAPLDR